MNFSPQITEIVNNVDEILVRALLSDDAAQQFSKGEISKSNLAIYAKAILKISESYLSVAPRGEPPVTSELDARSYALYYLPVNLPKLVSVIRFANQQLKRPSRLRILDYGCGPGTAALAAIQAISGEISISAFDSHPEMIRVCKAVLSAASEGQQRVEWRVQPAEQVDHWNQHELVIAANVFNELSQAEQGDLSCALYGATAQGGIIAIVEPGLQRTSRELMNLRNEMLKRFPDLTAIYPCTRQDSCPMLETARDWCHLELQPPQSRLVKQLDSLTGFNKHKVKFSALLLQKGGSPLPGYRLVSPIARTKHGFSGTLCGQGFYGPVSLPKKNVSDANRSFRKASMHDRLLLSEAPSSEPLRPDCSIHADRDL